jgi:hypothetical protein
MKPIIMSMEDEQLVLEDNLILFQEMSDFLRDAIDTFRVMSRQREYKSYEDLACYTLIKYLTQTRYMLSELGEDIRTFENNYLDFFKWKNEGLKKAKIINKGVVLSKVERIF